MSYGVNDVWKRVGKWLHYSLLFVVVCRMNRIKTYKRDSGDDAMKKG